MKQIRLFLSNKLPNLKGKTDAEWQEMQSKNHQLKNQIDFLNEENQALKQTIQELFEEKQHLLGKTEAFRWKFENSQKQLTEKNQRLSHDLKITLQKNTQLKKEKALSEAIAKEIQETNTKLKEQLDKFN